MHSSINTSKSLVAVSAIGAYEPNMAGEITQTFLKCECDIKESRFSVMGDRFLLMALLAGNWNAIAKIETALARLGQRLDLTFVARRASEKIRSERHIPYVMEVVTTQNRELVHEVVRFFELQKVDIEELHSGGYVATHTKSAMLSLQLTISVPPEISISSFRSDFVDFCEQLNIDAVLEPAK